MTRVSVSETAGGHDTTVRCPGITKALPDDLAAYYFVLWTGRTHDQFLLK
jgi:hypothetical protein